MPASRSLRAANLPLLPGRFQLAVAFREDLYYQDMRKWPVRKQYDEVVRELRASACREIAMDINLFQLEYPETRFVHVNTQNPSKKYEGRMAAVKPCVHVCLACDRWLEHILARRLPE